MYVLLFANIFIFLILIVTMAYDKKRRKDIKSIEIIIANADEKLKELVKDHIQREIDIKNLDILLIEIDKKLLELERKKKEGQDHER